jgi:hypothetical protein
VPYAQAAHSPPSGPVYPGSHSQSATTLLPPGELEASGQLVQAPATKAPRVPEYVPASQSTQELDADAPTVVAYLPAPQLAKSLPCSEPVLVRYLPAVQSMQASGPNCSLYFPARQATHVGAVSRASTLMVLPMPSQW